MLLMAYEPGSEAWDRQRRSQIITLLGAAVLCFAVAVGSPSIELDSEARVAESVREMAESGDLLIPHLCGEPHLVLPPLYPWLARLTSWIHGDVTVTTVRIPSVLAGIALVFMVYETGRRLWAPSSGFMAGMLLMTTCCVCRVARTGNPEIVLACAIFPGIMAMLGVLPLAPVVAGDIGGAIHLGWGTVGADSAADLWDRILLGAA